MKHKKFFTETLLSWNLADNTRAMPWKGEKDPYKIWISEIILQQTRVNQGITYYHKFIKSFPDVKTLAKSPEHTVFKHWEGLGYYSRCRNLLNSAKFIDQHLDGNFPTSFEDILALKGIGNYTAAAIASFAFNLPYAVVDGNVQRVLSRFFGIEIPVDTTQGKKQYQALANELLDVRNAGIYNQAIMDFGATICKPALPVCNFCPLQSRCSAYNQNLVTLLPRKEKSIKKRNRFFTYVLAEYENKIYTRKRTDKDIWQGLYEFILLENTSIKNERQLKKSKEFAAIFNKSNFEITGFSQTFTQKLTHQTIVGNFMHLRLTNKLFGDDRYSLVSKKDIKQLPFPKFITSYLED